MQIKLLKRFCYSFSIETFKCVWHRAQSASNQITEHLLKCINSAFVLPDMAENAQTKLTHKFCVRTIAGTVLRFRFSPTEIFYQSKTLIDA